MARPSTTRLILNNALFGEEEEAVEAEQKPLRRRCCPIASLRFPQQAAPPSALIRTGLIKFQTRIVSKVLKQST